MSELPPFQRTPEEWAAMSAPRLLWDDEEALRVARLLFRPGYRLDGIGAERQVERLLIRRIRSDVAGAALARSGRLTDRERERWRWVHAPDVSPGRWRDDVTVADVLEGRLPDGPA